MYETTLKNYLKYLKKIEDFAKGSHIRIFWKESAEDSFQHRGAFIIVDSTLSEADEIATLLHELGHGIDASFILKESEKLFWAYTNVYEETGTTKQSKLVYEAEKRAWDNGRLIAKRLKIPLGKWYSKAEKESLKSYKVKK